MAKRDRKLAEILNDPGEIYYIVGETLANNRFVIKNSYTRAALYAASSVIAECAHKDSILQMECTTVRLYTRWPMHQVEEWRHDRKVRRALRSILGIRRKEWKAREAT